jgi:hypothetical protein
MTNATTTQTAQAENAYEVQVLSIRPVRGTTGQLKAIARVRVGPLAINQVRVLETDNGDLWAAIAQLPVRKNGTGWTSLVDFLDYRAWEAVRKAATAAWCEYRDANGAL